MALSVALPTAATPPPQSERPVNYVAAVLELAVRIASADRLSSVAKCLADGLAALTSAEQVVVGFPRGRISPTTDHRVQLVASSAVQTLERLAPLAQSLESLLNTCSAEEPFVWLSPPASGEFSSDARLARLAIRTSDGVVRAVAGLVWSPSRRNEALERLLISAAQTLAPVVALQQRSAPRPIHALRQLMPSWLSARVGGCIAAALLGLLAVPWPYRIGADVTLEPITQRFVAAPFEGLFEQSDVLPGDRVEPGQRLGRMDGRELRTKLAANDADAARAARSRDMNLAGNKLAAAQIDRLEMERLAHERALLEHRLQQLEIRTPIGGIIVSGDLRRQAGATVQVGQTLYEVAPLDRLIAQVAIAEHDIESITLGAALDVSIDAISARPLRGTLIRIHPRAEIRDEQQVFIGEMVVENERGVYRPGMHGRAHIVGAPTPGLWKLLRRPYLACRSLLGW